MDMEGVGPTIEMRTLVMGLDCTNQNFGSFLGSFNEFVDPPQSTERRENVFPRASDMSPSNTTLILYC